MCLCNIARNAQSKPGAAGVTIARGLDPIERLEHPLQLLRGNAGGFIPDADNKSFAVLNNDFRAHAELHCIRHEIRQQASERLWLTHEGLRGLALYRDVR